MPTDYGYVTRELDKLRRIGVRPKSAPVLIEAMEKILVNAMDASPKLPILQAGPWPSWYRIMFAGLGEKRKQLDNDEK